MFAYQLKLAWLNFKRAPALTALMVVAIGLGVGASMTSLQVLRAMSGDPISWKSDRLFYVQIDSWGEQGRRPGGNNEPADQLSYTDAQMVMNAKQAKRQVASFRTGVMLKSADPQFKPLTVSGRATYKDFFPMFDVPFAFGSGWSAADDERRGQVVVLSHATNEKVFGGGDTVGKSVFLDQVEFKVIGVLKPWAPRPKFYDLTNSNFANAEEFYLPYTYAVANDLPTWGNNNCVSDPGEGREAYLASTCVWQQAWVELESPSDKARYLDFLNNYSTEQKKSGKILWEPNNRLRNVREWMQQVGVVSSDVQISAILSLGFLLVCLINTAGLMLAKSLSRAGEIGLKRALGASRNALFSQGLMDALLVACAGALLGGALTWGGLFAMRKLGDQDVQNVAQLDPMALLLVLGCSVLATLLAALYPTWRASLIAPAVQLKTN